MESPFFRNYYNAPPSTSFPRSYYYASPAPRTIPVDTPTAQRVVPPRPPAERAALQPAPKVVSIPIHFVGSEKSRANAAVRIQKVFRGFLVRRSVRKIWKIRSEVGEMEQRIEREGMADLMRRDEKERLRVNEMLMGLLLRLDAVPGVDPAVRICRKLVIRRVVALQERVDALSSRVEGAMEEESHSAEAISQTVEGQVPDRTPEVVDDAPTDIADAVDDQVIKTSDSAHREGQVLEDFERREPVFEGVDAIAPEAIDSADRSVLETSGSSGNSASETADGDAIQTVDAAVSSGDYQTLQSAHEAQPCERVDPADSGAVDIINSNDDTMEEVPQNDESSVEEEKGGGSQVPDMADAVTVDEHACVQKVPRDQVEDVKGVMERMVEENQKLQRLVYELCERNLLQNRLMHTLSHRVEKLENVVAQKARKKKKLGSPSNACPKRRHDL